MEKWDTEQVAQFVTGLGLESAYGTAMRDNEITGSLLVHANHAMLRSLGITSVGHRIAILSALSLDSSSISNLHAPTNELVLEHLSSEILFLRQEIRNLREEISPLWSLLDNKPLRRTPSPSGSHSRSSSKSYKILSPLTFENQSVEGRKSFDQLKSNNSSKSPGESIGSNDVGNNPLSPNNRSDIPINEIANNNSIGIIRICLDGISNNGLVSKIAPPSITKAFQVSESDACSKIIASILKKYNIIENWKLFGFFFFTTGGQGDPFKRRLQHDEKPLVIVKQEGGGGGIFAIKRIESEHQFPATQYRQKLHQHQLQQQQNQQQTVYSSNQQAPLTSILPTQNTPTYSQKTFKTDSQRLESLSTSNTFIAIFNYRASRADELNVTAGDRFQVLKRDRDWVTAQNINTSQTTTTATDNLIGWIPLGCLKELTVREIVGNEDFENVGTRNGSSSGDSGSVVVGVTADMVLPVSAVVLYDFDGNGIRGELRVYAGQRVLVVKKEKEWVFVKSENGKKGWIPNAYVSVTSEIFGPFHGGTGFRIERNPLAKIANLLDHFDDITIQEEAPAEKKSAGILTLIEGVNVGIGRWIELEHRQESVLTADKSIVLDRLETGLQLISLVQSKANKLISHPQRNEISRWIEKASETCNLSSEIGNSCNVSDGGKEDERLEVVITALKTAIQLLQ
ncbi:Adaptor for signal transduction [Physocladia obscura]|uniref:Adaptor for signal transduction n=1 Tax=Physocladia obscura TaxID=109957 RepID=A0AAD5XIX1_9FUNG|nr:Adaptor for signal transduction [Physocladia obscura]